MKVLLVLALISLAALASARKPLAARYDNFKVYRAYVKDSEQLEEFKKIHQHIQVGERDKARETKHQLLFLFFSIFCLGSYTARDWRTQSQL